jgi:hypothetical protein
MMVWWVAFVLGVVVFILLGVAWYVYVIAALVGVIVGFAAWLLRIELWR